MPLGSVRTRGIATAPESSLHLSAKEAPQTPLSTPTVRMENPSRSIIRVQRCPRGWPAVTASRSCGIRNEVVLRSVGFAEDIIRPRQYRDPADALLKNLLSTRPIAEWSNQFQGHTVSGFLPDAIGANSLFVSGLVEAPAFIVV